MYKRQVSDDTKVIFNLNLQGKIIANSSFLIELKDLEGLAVTSDENEIIAVHESSNSVVHFDITNRKEIRRTPLSAMKNYDKIVNHFRNDDRNKDLEGITIDSNNDHVSIVKDGKPGSPFNSIQNTRKSSIVVSLTKNVDLNIGGLSLRSLTFLA